MRLPFVALAFVLSCVAANAVTLENGRLRATFNSRGLASLVDLRTGRQTVFSGDAFNVQLDGAPCDSIGLGVPKVSKARNTIVFEFARPGGAVKAEYRLEPGWGFLAKRLILPASVRRIGEVEVMRGTLGTGVASVRLNRRGSYGAFVRLAELSGPPKTSLFFAVQNPFLKWSIEGGAFRMAYPADMDWKLQYGPHETDYAIIGVVTLIGATMPEGLAREWEYVQDPASWGAARERVDAAEIDGLTAAVDAFVLWRPKKTAKLQVGWTLNDYQIDIATPEGRAEYKRVLDVAADVGCTTLLFAPANSQVSSQDQNVDAWGWENLLWLTLGQKVRKDEWTPGKDAIPPTVKEMLDYAKGKGIRLVAYVYPTLGWKQDPEWTRWCDGKTGGYSGVDTGVRSFQDWFVNKLVTFQNATGCGGFSFDHWWMAYDPPATSRYAQWYGTRRILVELRKRLPDVVIDGRQQYHGFGPWTWVAGSFPHPLASDEQPQSFPAFPDLRFSRVSADRQRRTFWWYRNENFTPTSIMPGYTTHQTQRSTKDGTLMRTAFRQRDWDVIGWKYSVISSIGTAPVNNVVNLIPGRDTQEYRAFSKADRAWFRKWLDFTDRNRAVLEKVRPIIHQPMVGAVDGSAAIDGDRGFIFLFNPNMRRLRAEFKLNESIGLTSGDRYSLRELYPVEGRYVGSATPAGWSRGDAVSLELEGASAVVLELRPALKTGAGPTVMNVPGKATLKGGVLAVTGVTGEAGTRQSLQVALPPGSKVDSLTVNGREVTFSRDGDEVVAPVRFVGEPFHGLQQVGAYDPAFRGGTFRGSFRIPARVFQQLEARRKAWPVDFTEDDLLAPWLGADRLLLYVQIAEPNDKMAVSLAIDGREVPLKPAYSCVYPQAVDHTFTGYYADVSALKPDTDYQVTITLPELKPGQFQGLFFENVETEYTSDVAAG